MLPSVLQELPLSKSWFIFSCYFAMVLGRVNTTSAAAVKNRLLTTISFLHSTQRTGEENYNRRMEKGKPCKTTVFFCSD